ncbi:acyl-homoserine-lactone synthase [Oricola cellulosilytica]|uniref:Acyl-homoserine-lactone synthase n=1 Tax=Oricola cellulosilytica TaxID=1429082 RepID=A0A4R0PEM5_9HYPH|nr:acyl-homoserine-lactone synthase [Oricola cellulosilytica]TCD15223.1 hypothetical protein E0D97_06680 [Oricola cellulosilytica]
MIVYVETPERERHARLVDDYFQLRKRVFHDEMGWNVRVTGELERDVLDEHPCTYGLSVDAGGRLNAGIRLIPTTQMTLLELAFDGLVPDRLSFRSPTIWEVSRFCIDRTAPGGWVSAGLDRAALELMLANFGYARRNGITHYLAVTEERMLRLAGQFGIPVDVLGRQQIEGCDVVCGLIPVNSQTATMARKMQPLVEGRKSA